jgi:hypothetical protein
MRRQTGVRDAMHAIEHQTAGAVEKPAGALVMRQIDHGRDPESVPYTQRFQQLAAAFLAAVMAPFQSPERGERDRPHQHAPEPAQQ